VQECAAGLVELRHDGGELAFAAPPTTQTGPLEDAHLAALIRALGISRDRVLDHQWVDNGPGWCGLLLASAQDVLDLEPDFTAVPDAKVGVIGAHPTGAPQQFEVRAFAPGMGVHEDPVTGSLNASLAQWLIRTGQAPERYTAAQGTRLGRAGRVSIDRIGDDTWVGGATSVVFQGTAAV
jgi:PhzF family phenazine biosynthesis protein